LAPLLRRQDGVSRFRGVENETPQIVVSPNHEKCIKQQILSQDGDVLIAWRRRAVLIGGYA